MRTVKFNAVRVAEITITVIETPSVISAKAAFVNTETGNTHGWTTCKSWSADTLEKLRELREFMERDIAAIHFTDGAIGPGATTSGGGIRETFKGLGEHLGTSDDPVPQG